MQPLHHLKNYLISVCRLTGATSTSILISTESESDVKPVLLHHGAPPFVPELGHDAAATDLLGNTNTLTADDKVGQSACLHGVASTDENALLLRIFTEHVEAILRNDPGLYQGNSRRSDSLESSGLMASTTVWLGMRFSSKPGLQFTEELLRSNGNDPTRCAIGKNGLPWSLAYEFYAAWHLQQLTDLLQDPTSHLPGRLEFKARLEQLFNVAGEAQQPVAIALINPDDFALVNHRLGREQGDLAIREIAERLQSILRQSDTLFRYGGAVFGLIMQATNEEEANMAAERLRIAMSQQAILNGAVRLTFSIGLAIYDSDAWNSKQIDTDEMVRRADRALNAAKLSGGGCTTTWAPDGLASVVENLDRLNGIFTADNEKDYRNMLMLWDMISLITSNPDSQAIASAFVERLNVTFKPSRIGLYEHIEEDELILLAACRGQPRRKSDRSAETRLSLTPNQQNLLHKAVKARRSERLRERTGKSEADAAKSVIAYAVPLVAGQHCLGCLYVDGPEVSFILDSSDLIFLSTLANQVAIALDRAKLAAQWIQQKEHESQRLKQEVRGLRNALQHSRLVYRSLEMQNVLDVLRRIAPTEATVLITGESGTGKEVLARTIHEQSKRHNQPFVTVDCGAISQSLMDAELFGRVKGAYTGAQEDAKGRIVHADGGTLFLDEIGELPLEVQTKLLRLVQEKEIMPVGSSESRKIDVRIIAATNRNLAAESAAGTFRQDLYYRLQVVTLTSPPLRERRDDILPLAYYFLEKYAVQNDKAARQLSPDAEAALLDHPWAGNVRELQNRILQAVVMSESEVIDNSVLELDSSKNNPPAPTLVAAGTDNQSALEYTKSAPPSVNIDAHARPNDVQQQIPENIDPWDLFRDEIGRQVKHAMNKGNGILPPLGRWLTADLVRVADATVQGNARKGCALLGMAETTFRRQLDKARQLDLGGQAIRSEDWSAMEPVVAVLIAKAESSPAKGLLDRANQMLLEQILLQLPDNDTRGSALLGVTKPTFLRRKTALQQH